jgi:2-oxoglutarate ferredoxin oxidoreductase subunit alpha
MSNAELNVVIGGEAEQELETIGVILSRILVRAGYHIVATQSYGTEIQGGTRTFAVRVSPEHIYAAQEHIDILVALNDETVSQHEGELSLRGIIVASQDLGRDDQSCLSVPYAELAESTSGHLVALGITCRLLGLSESLMDGIVDEFFSGEEKEVARMNRDSAMSGYRWISKQAFKFPPLQPVEWNSSRLAMTGQDAIAFGALSARLKFLSLYPMSPATSIATALSAHSHTASLVVARAEDEIAAINMALGASFVGAPSMAATAGEGLAIIGQSLSLSAMTKTPLVVVVVQRRGLLTEPPVPAEEAELDLVLHSAQDGLPGAVLAPGDIEECFFVIQKAFDIAQKSCGPVFVLTDQFLIDSSKDVEPFPIDDLERAGTCVESAHSPQQHMNVSPRVSEEVRDRSVRGPEVIKTELLYPEVTGDEAAELVLISWGSTKGAVLEAAAMLRTDGRTVAVIHVPQIWPLPLDHLLEMLSRAEEVVCVEGSPTGQLARLIYRETGFNVKRSVLRHDGLPITPEFILRELSRPVEGITVNG